MPGSTPSLAPWMHQSACPATIYLTCEGPRITSGKVTPAGVKGIATARAKTLGQGVGSDPRGGSRLVGGRDRAARRRDRPPRGRHDRAGSTRRRRTRRPRSSARSGTTRWRCGATTSRSCSPVSCARATPGPTPSPTTSPCWARRSTRSPSRCNVRESTDRWIRVRRHELWWSDAPSRRAWAGGGHRWSAVPRPASASVCLGRRSVGRRSEVAGMSRPRRSAVVQSASAMKRRCRPRLLSMS